MKNERYTTSERKRVDELAALRHHIQATPKSRSRFVQKRQGKSGPVIRIKPDGQQ